MLRARMTTFDLSGEWQGHYEQNRRQHGISMRVVQRGQSFVGAMRDVDTLLASAEALTPPSGDGTKPETVQAEVLSSLPEHSTIEGEIEGRLVSFVKSYRGTSTTHVRVPGRAQMTFAAPGHQVQYRGTLTPAGDEFAGYWTIPPRHGERTLRGRFVLRRVATSPTT